MSRAQAANDDELNATMPRLGRMACSSLYILYLVCFVYLVCLNSHLFEGAY